MRNKKADIAISLLVLMVFVLTVTALFIFLQSSVNAKIINARFLDFVNAEELRINFEIREIFERAVEKSMGDDFKINFPEKLTEGLGGYKKLLESIEYGDEVKVKFKINIEKEFEGLHVIYVYTKEFKAKL